MFTILKFWTTYRANADGSMRGIDMVAYAPIGRSQASVTEDAVARLAKARQPDPMSEDEAGKMAWARWMHIKPAYEAWKSGQQLPENGTPLSAWTAISQEQADILRGAGLRSVEDIAGMTDTVMGNVRLPNVRELREQARRFLAAFDKNATAARIEAAENRAKEVENDLAEMKALLLEMQKERDDARALALEKTRKTREKEAA